VADSKRDGIDPAVLNAVLGEDTADGTGEDGAGEGAAAEPRGGSGRTGFALALGVLMLVASLAAWWVL